MVIPPIAAEQAIRQLLEAPNKTTSIPTPHPASHSKTFGDEMMRHMQPSITTAQQNLILQQGTRPQTFLPLTQEGGNLLGAANSTSNRKQTKHKKASTAYNSAPHSFIGKK